MFIIRAAFWLALLVAILPSDPREQARLYQTASHALHTAATFCDRNEAVCTEAEAQWGVFKEKLAVGARMATDLVNEQISGHREVAAGPRTPLPAVDTLRPADRRPLWEGRERTRL